jgi:hypothetical protein
MLGVLHGWATTDRTTIEPWVLAILQSPLPIIVATTLIGMVTNSWTIATITGALTLVTAEFAADVARWYWFDEYALMAEDTLLQFPIALLAGGALGLGGCVWHHESGYTRSIGAALLAGPLGWLCWRELATDDWTMDLAHLSGWIAGALGLVVLARCRGLGAIVIALIGAVVVAIGIEVISAGEAFDLRSSLSTFREQWNQLIDQLRSGI